jgi:CAP-Gly domain-containing linker protein 1
MTSVRSRASEAPFQPKIGDPVKIIGMGMEGVLRYLGAIDGKAGEWAGVELDPGFAGKGKNDGSVGE